MGTWSASISGNDIAQEYSAVCVNFRQMDKYTLDIPLERLSLCLPMSSLEKVSLHSPRSGFCDILKKTTKKELFYAVNYFHYHPLLLFGRVFERYSYINFRFFFCAVRILAPTDLDR